MGARADQASPGNVEDDDLLQVRKRQHNTVHLPSRPPPVPTLSLEPSKIFFRWCVRLTSTWMRSLRFLHERTTESLMPSHVYKALFTRRFE